MPNDGDLVDSLRGIAPTQAELELLLVRNPEACFDFASSA
jgi:hypothetical protein